MANQSPDPTSITYKQLRKCAKLASAHAEIICRRSALGLGGQDRADRTSLCSLHSCFRPNRIDATSRPAQGTAGNGACRRHKTVFRPWLLPICICRRPDFTAFEMRREYAMCERPLPNHMIARSLVVCAWIIFAWNPLLSQGPAVAIPVRAPYRDRTSPRSTIRVETSLTLVPLTVTDSRGYPVAGLPRSSFRVYEDGVEQNVVSFQAEAGPVSVGFVVDTSESMRKRMAASTAALGDFLRTTTMPGDEYWLMSFGGSPSLMTTFTRRLEDILAVLPSLHPDGLTPLNDAVYLGVQDMKPAKNGRKALIVLTDGGDNNSRYSDSEVLHLVQEADVRVYAIGFFTRPGFLLRLASESGGRTFELRNIADLPETIDKLDRLIRNEYVLGYAPKNHATDGRYRRIQVRLISTSQATPLRISWRHGYLAPED